MMLLLLWCDEDVDGEDDAAAIVEICPSGKVVIYVLSDWVMVSTKPLRRVAR